jgi:hypothetical protein
VDKLEVARRQLGTALWLYLNDYDPVAVQSLACGAGEILESLASHAGLESSSKHILKTNPLMEPRNVRSVRNVYWNAFKHATVHNESLRADQETLDAFSDVKNDAALLLAWMDYEKVTGRMPIAAQVFQTWFFAVNEEKLSSGLDRGVFRKAFPGIGALDRSKQKQMLQLVWRDAEADDELLNNKATEPSLLVLMTS